MSGMGIRVDYDINDDETIQICCELGDYHVTINAEIAWQKKPEDNGFRIGVQFSNENMNNNVSLYTAL